ncbi:MFS transporter [Pseudonocardia sp. N23]|uniref:MFS transporter n=1 Tax=Pseudonocardia sp. N23 TaxID=1987376 RepID=UPI001558E0EC|nr:MFS transporter [Pseudonocardia sp. N23]
MAEEVQKQEVVSAGPSDSMRRRAIASAGVGWGLDGVTWTMYSFALTVVLPVLSISRAQVGWITFASIAASAVGGIVCGNLADRFGRVRVLTYVILGYSLFTGLTATAQDMTQFIIWRVLEGFVFGGEWAVGAALVAEYLNPRVRGRVMGFIHGCYSLGWAISTALYLIVFSIAPPETAWRYLFLLGVLPAVAAFIIRRTMRDRVDVGTVAPERKARVRDLFAPGLRKTSILATMLGLACQGIYYSVFVFLPLYLSSVKGFSVVGTAMYTWVVIAGSFLGAVTAGFLHDAIGRRRAFWILLACATGAIALFVLSPLVGEGFVGYLICFSLGFFAQAQSAGLGAYLAELFPTSIRATGQGFAYNVGRGIAGVGPLTIGILADQVGLGGAILWVGGVSACLGMLAVAGLRETRNTDILGDVR